ncbi:ABC transporter ATP-binding protein [Rubellimicrobium rubrum]|uniref:ABC transporter ATP-binding protein n=1 Tax=Rubellimicrobium rubrum TaxID=2585369 RepID=A0A5C4MRD3_9RHOB|nr:ABC transporter ATP-binding protein [Rubellimicrobium rubrum]TNC46921.1 ABC transporter ATP-binding protein [Rubellimicrobium rubrum]
MTNETLSRKDASPQANVFGIAARVMGLAREERPVILSVGLLGLASAIFEAVGLSFMIPLARIAMGEGIDFTIPVIGPLLKSLGSFMELSGTLVVLLVVGFSLVGIIVSYVNQVLSNALAMRFADSLRRRVFETALDRPLSQIEALPSGSFINNLASETWKVCDALFIVIGGTVQFIAFSVFLVLLLLLAPFYTFVLLGMTGAMGLVLYATAQAVRELGIKAVAANERLMAYIWDAFGGLRVIRGFGQEDHEREQFGQRSQDVRHVFTRLRNLSAIVGPITQVVTIAMVATILGLAMLRGDSLATLVGFFAIAFRMQPRVMGLLNAWTSLKGLEGSVSSVEKAFGASGAKRHGQWRTFPGVRGELTLEGVSARYPNTEQPALHDISCRFRAGEVTAVAGYSGAGKSTLAALLLRFIEPSEGRILVDGQPLSSLDPIGWNRRIAFVEQNAFLFNATIRDNIGYGDIDVSFDEIREAARIAQADSFIDALPQGYDTMIGDSGVRLSQGQRQRIALARAIVRKPDVLILDEATNALDRPTERALRDAMTSGPKARVVVVIAHRRESIEVADNVVVLDGGRVVEEGSPAALAARGGVYAHLYLDEAETPDPS